MKITITEANGTPIELSDLNSDGRHILRGLIDNLIAEIDDLDNEEVSA